jgi:hypothetical protein
MSWIQKWFWKGRPLVQEKAPAVLDDAAGAISDDEFIETQIQFQLGHFGRRDFSIPIDELHRTCKFPSAIFGVFDAHTQQVLSPNACDKCVTVAKNGQWQADFANKSVNRKGRIAGFLNSIRLYSAKKHYAFDFWDGRTNNLNHWFAGEPFPIFQYNRLNHDSHAILWPLHHYHTIDNPYFLERHFSDPIRFEDKQPKICWRGMPTGGGFDLQRNTAVGIEKLVAHFAAGSINAETLREQLLLIKRYKFVALFSGHALFDAGFAISNPNQQFLAQHEGFAGYLKPPLTKWEHCRFKYLVALSGWDVATSFYWMLGTNSVVFKESYEHEVFADCHFKPWVHYVPISPDFDDIIAKYEWCETNTNACLVMVKNANAVCQKLLSRDLRRKILGAVINRYENRLHS